MADRTRILAAHALPGIALALWAAAQAPAFAGSNEQAERMFGRLTGSQPSASVLAQMSTDIAGGSSGAISAAMLAMQDPAFYNVTIRNFAAPMTNKAQSVFVPLNDYSATVIGMVRDNVPFNTVLSADLVYVASGSTGAPAYSTSTNAMYQYLDDNAIDLSNPANLQSTTQSSVIGIPTAATAGVMTTEAGAGAFFYKGTNRAMVRFTMMNYLCDDLQYIADTTRPSDRIRQDPARSPGGDSRVFMNQCIGCHSGMDALAGAFAYYDFNLTTNMETYTPGQVVPKYSINTSNFAYGYVTTDDSWKNYWRSGPNALLGWSSSLPAASNGAKAFGEELESSQQFVTCQVQKVFQVVCLRPPGNTADYAQVTQISADFVANNYSMKQVFAETAVYCMGQ